MNEANVKSNKMGIVKMIRNSNGGCYLAVRVPDDQAAKCSFINLVVFRYVSCSSNNAYAGKNEGTDLSLV